MKFKHFVVVHLVDVVARKNDNIFGSVAFNKSDILIDSVCGTLIPFRAQSGLVRRQTVCSAVLLVKVPRLTVADIVVEYQGLVLGKYAYGVNTRIYTV